MPGSANYKALILDMDGTLLHAGRKTISKTAVQALTALQQRGVLVILATGRGPVACGAAVLGGLAPDYSVFNNGANVQSQSGEMLHEERFALEDMDALLHYTEEFGYPLCFLFEDAYYAYNHYEEYCQRYHANWGNPVHVKDGSAHTRHRQSMPFAAFALMPEEAAAAFGQKKTNLRMIHAAKNAYDVCKLGVDKAAGLAVLLEKMGLGWQDVVALGDGDNDAAMLQNAGMGIAMANAGAMARNAANCVAPCVQRDGVLWVIERFFGANTGANK